MRILLAATPATVHLDPILALARLLVTSGHDVVVTTAGILRARVEATGARFNALAANAVIDEALLDTFPAELIIVDTLFRDRLPGLPRAGARHPMAGLMGGDFTEHDAPQ